MNLSNQILECTKVIPLSTSASATNSVRKPTKVIPKTQKTIKEVKSLGDNFLISVLSVGSEK